MGKKVIEQLAIDGGKGYVFYCPGCKYYHSYQTELGENKSRPIWSFNGDMEKPTFTPSLLVNGFSEKRCHLFVTNGQIQYCSDSWHELSGQTIDMQESDWSS